MLQVGSIIEVDGRGEAVVVEAEQPEPSDGPSGAGKVEAIENQVGDSAMAAADAEPRPGTWVSRIGPGGERIQLVRIGFEIQQCRKFRVREIKMEEREYKNCYIQSPHCHCFFLPVFTLKEKTRENGFYTQNRTVGIKCSSGARLPLCRNYLNQ